MKKKIVYVDMDGVICDFDKSAENYLASHPHLIEMYKNNRIDLIPTVFKNPPLMPGVLKALNTLHKSGKFELVVATAASWDHPTAESDKKHYIANYFEHIFRKNMVITHRKDLLIGDYLIDDRLFNGASEFKGELIQFGSDEFPDWPTVVEYLMNK